MTKSQQRTALILIAIVVIVVLLIVVSRKPTEQQSAQRASDTTSYTSFHGMPREGNGGDPGLNRQKNRWSEPTTFRDLSVEQIIAYPHEALDEVGREEREHWTSQATQEANKYENEGGGVRVEGYLIAAKVSGPETCNNRSTVYRDDHLWLASDASDSKRDAIVVEVTPFYNERHPEWDIHTLLALAKERARIRISGWVLWDDEHASEVGKSRGSLWEIHPITRIEIGGNNNWHDLATSGPL